MAASPRPMISAATPVVTLLAWIIPAAAASPAVWVAGVACRLGMTAPADCLTTSTTCSAAGVGIPASASGTFLDKLILSVRAGSAWVV